MISPRDRTLAIIPLHIKKLLFNKALLDPVSFHKILSLRWVIRIIPIPQTPFLPAILLPPLTLLDILLLPLPLPLLPIHRLPRPLTFIGPPHLIPLRYLQRLKLIILYRLIQRPKLSQLARTAWFRNWFKQAWNVLRPGDKLKALIIMERKVL